MRTGDDVHVNAITRLQKEDDEDDTDTAETEETAASAPVTEDENGGEKE